ncbi:MAG: Tol-Pal system beta propeller repeat protein TolB [Myxococcales bacterium]|nr:Tol-Pal system beta propeller repeat protein TolB [Myxococcales bacterium]
MFSLPCYAHKGLGLLLLAVNILPLSKTASAKPQSRRVIEVGSPNFRPYPIAIPSARVGDKSTNAAKIALAMTQALRFDFDIIAQFDVLDPKSYITNPAKEGMTAPTIKFESWINVGAEGLLKALVRGVSGKYQAELIFFDVAAGRPLVSKRYSTTLDSARSTAHSFANEVVRSLTGEPGIFQTKIAAVRNTPSGRELWLLELDGSRETPVTKNGSLNLLPAWTRDGRGLIFTSYVSSRPSLYRIDISGGRLSLLAGERGLNTGGVMSPDSKKIAMTLSRDGNSEVYVMNANRTGLRRLTNEWAIDSSPSWSPDGTQLAFVSSRFGDPHIFTMNADGSRPRRLTDKGNYNTTPDWSPRGDVIAFTARDERNVFDIFTVNVKSREIRRLTQDQGNNEEPSFSPDGNHIVFTSTREGRSQVWVMAVDGSNQRRLTPKGGYSTPAWSPFTVQ